MKYDCTTCDKIIDSNDKEQMGYCRNLRHELLNLPNEQSTEEKQNITEKIHQFAKQRIKKLVVSNVDLNSVFALIEINDHIESIDISSGKAQHWLQWSYHNETTKICATESYRHALSMIKSEAIMSTTSRENIYNRIAMTKDAIYYDLASQDWKILKITKNTIEIIGLDENTPIFTRKQHQRPQIEPKFDDPTALDKLVDLLRMHEMKHLFKIHLVSFFLEAYQMPIMVFVGEQGSIKTTITKSIKRIVDPSGEITSSLPKKTDDLLLHLHSRYLVSFDNISYFDQEISNIFCRAITGDGTSKRQLYTDSDEVIWTYIRKIILNGIAPPLEYPDLRDRCIIYKTTPIKEEERITELEFSQRLEEILPSVLGQIFKILQQMLLIYDDVKFESKSLPRMADFTKFGECISQVIGYTPFSFIEAYKTAIDINSVEVIESYPIISLTEKIMKNKDHYEDTVSNFHNNLKGLAAQEGIDTHSRYVNFPSFPNKVMPHIQKIKPIFRTSGFEIDVVPYDKRDGLHRRGSHVIYINRIEQQSNLFSYTPKESLSSLSRGIQTAYHVKCGFGEPGVYLSQYLSKTT